MRRFKTKTKKKLKNRKVIFLLIFLLILFIFSYKISKKVNISDEMMKNITFAYLGINMKEKPKKNKVVQVIEKVNDPLIYIYNSHQTENYSFNKLESYNIDYNVLYASYILDSYLDDYAIVEDTPIKDVLVSNDYDYSDSYKASRILMEKAKANNASLKYYIDIHRDSALYDTTTCEIDGVKYARILFIIGLENNNYKENEEFVNILNDKLKNFNECLTRGILEKSGEGVNGVYNQDFSPYVILIEVGGVENTIDEVNNTLELFAKFYKETLNL